jgi:hypothetical protein
MESELSFCLVRLGSLLLFDAAIDSAIMGSGRLAAAAPAFKFVVFELATEAEPFVVPFPFVVVGAATAAAAGEICVLLLLLLLVGVIG